MPAFLVASLASGLGTGMLTPPQGAAVADVIGVQGKGGPVLAAYQMAADIGAILGPLAAGVLANQLSFSAAFGVTGAIAAVVAVFWLRAPETLPRRSAVPDHIGTDIAGVRMSRRGARGADRHAGGRPAPSPRGLILVNQLTPTPMSSQPPDTS